MISTLAELVAPLPDADFHALLRARTPLVQRGAGLGRYAGLTDWDAFLGAVLDGTLPPAKLRVTQRGASLPPRFYAEDGALKREAVERVMEVGGSIVAHGIEEHVPALGRLCTAIATATGERVSAGIIATSGEGGALSLHYDVEDLVILQIEGAKRWIVESEPVKDPVRGMPVAPGHVAAPPCIDTVVEAGDWLFLPAGHWHRCETVGGRSLHAAIFFLPLTEQRALGLIARALMEQADARRPLRDGLDAAALKAALKGRIDAMPIAELLDRHQRMV